MHKTQNPQNSGSKLATILSTEQPSLAGIGRSNILHQVKPAVEREFDQLQYQMMQKQNHREKEKRLCRIICIVAKASAKSSKIKIHGSL